MRLWLFIRVRLWRLWYFITDFVHYKRSGYTTRLAWRYARDR